MASQLDALSIVDQIIFPWSMAVYKSTGPVVNFYKVGLFEYPYSISRANFSF